MGYCHQADYRREMLLRFIDGFIAREHYPPTIEEMRRGLGWSTKSLVVFHLEALEAEGLIERVHGIARGVKIAEQMKGVRWIEEGGMSAAVLKRPGTTTGPCRGECQHRACAEMRAMAATICTCCKKPIGYGVRFYRDGETLVHGLCFEEAIEREMMLA